MDVSQIRRRTYEAVESLPLDNGALRQFYDAFLFRRSVVTSHEGMPDQEEVEALVHALAKALTEEFDVLHVATTADSVPQLFKDNLLQAVNLLSESPLRLFYQQNQERWPQASFVDCVTCALVEYALNQRNALNPEPW